MPDERFDKFDVIVACGGEGSRLRRSGVPVPTTKSWLTAAGEPALVWSLKGIACLDARIIVIADSDPDRLSAACRLAEEVLGRHVTPLLDPGLGLHGLPDLARPLLRSRRVFLVAGHGMVGAEHFRRLARVEAGCAATRVQIVGDAATRTRLPPDCDVDTGWWFPKFKNASGFFTLPYILDETYLDEISRANFSIQELLDSRKCTWTLVENAGAVEADVAPEWNSARAQQIGRRGATISIEHH